MRRAACVIEHQPGITRANRLPETRGDVLRILHAGYALDDVREKLRIARLLLPAFSGRCGVLLFETLIANVVHEPIARGGSLGIRCVGTEAARHV